MDRRTTFSPINTVGAMVCLLTLSLPGTVEAQYADHAGLLVKLDAVVQHVMDRDHLAGISIGVKKDGQVLVAKGYGYADLENGVEATEHTVHRIGSVTKQFTAAAIMLLVERGELRLDDDLTTFLPDYPMRGHLITIDQLLNHASGIKGFTEMGRRFQAIVRLDESHDDVIDLFSAEPFGFAPGERWQYNNSAYYLLGVIIERVTGHPMTNSSRPTCGTRWTCTRATTCTTTRSSRIEPKATKSAAAS